MPQLWCEGPAEAGKTWSCTAARHMLGLGDETSKAGYSSLPGIMQMAQTLKDTGIFIEDAEFTGTSGNRRREEWYNLIRQCYDRSSRKVFNRDIKFEASLFVTVRRAPI